MELIPLEGRGRKHDGLREKPVYDGGLMAASSDCRGSEAKMVHQSCSVLVQNVTPLLCLPPSLGEPGRRLTLYEIAWLSKGEVIPEAADNVSPISMHISYLGDVIASTTVTEGWISASILHTAFQFQGDSGFIHMV